MIDQLIGANSSNRASILRSKFQLSEPDYQAFEWLGLISDRTPLLQNAPSLLDALCGLLESKLKYAQGERDMICLHHSFGVETAQGEKVGRSPLIDGIIFLGSALFFFGSLRRDQRIFRHGQDSGSSSSHWRRFDLERFV